MHMHVWVLSNAGMFPISNVGAPGIHGEVVAGIQGIGVKTPDAAVVAVATVGFDGVVHIPKGLMFTMGTWSMMLAAGWLPDNVRLTGSTPKDDGATPKLHISMAPLTTWIGTTAYLLSRR